MNPRIVIIGAGASGIAAGSKLLSYGLKNIVILEAESRIGGRINTVPFADNIIDMGAQWCHGETNNAVYHLAEKYKPFDSTSKTYENDVLIKSNGERVSPELCNKLRNIVISILGYAQEDLKDFKGSLGTYMCNKYEQILKLSENSDIDNELAAQFLECYQKFECSIEASDTLFEVSGEGYLQYWECEGDKLLNWKDKGYITILKLLMGIYPNSNNKNILENKILLGKKVDQIIWDHPGISKCLIKCNNGETFEADHVICSVSVGVLKEQHLKLFSPRLPLSKVRAIDGITLGTVDKIFIEFSKPFWEDDWNGCMLLWQPQDLESIRKLKNNWIEDVFGFYPVDYQPNVMCGWICGAKAKQMEASSDKDVIDGIVFLLNKFWNQEIPAPIGLKRSSWFSNPNFRGSYSFRSIQTDLLKTGPADLASPILCSKTNVPVLQFAGEATHDHYYSTVHGAIESGWREAERLIHLYKNLKLIENESITTKDQYEVYDVIILGAGLAGLGAGYQLKSSNLKFKIFEAQNQVGGRVQTKLMLPFTNTKGTISSSNLSDLIDAGAQWLHGEQNKLYQIAEKNELLVPELSEEGLGKYIREDGHMFDDFFQKKIDFKIGKILEDCENFSMKENNYPKSVGNYLINQFNEFLREFPNDEERRQALQLLDWHNRFQIIDNSCLSLDQVSAKSWGLYSFNGESCQAHINFKNGFGSLIECVCDEIGMENILINSEICDIDWDILKNDKDYICVRTKDDEKKYLTKHIIVTCSLGVLKRLETKLFRPNLPEKFRAAINNIGYETINKIFLQFDHPWWDNMKGIQLIYNDDLYKNHKWTRYISGFDVLHPGAQNTLLAWVGSYGAIEMEELSNDEIVKDCMDLLKKFTKKSIPNPIKYFCSRWGKNEYIRGGYSYISTKCDETNTTGKSLSQPVTIDDLPIYKNDGVIENFKNLSIYNNGFKNVDQQKSSRPLILFAGEACHDKYFSTAHGAFLSGMEQAQNILNTF